MINCFPTLSVSPNTIKCFSGKKRLYNLYAKTKEGNCNDKWTPIYESLHRSIFLFYILLPGLGKVAIMRILYIKNFQPRVCLYSVGLYGPDIFACNDSMGDYHFRIGHVKDLLDSLLSSKWRLFDVLSVETHHS